MVLKKGNMKGISLVETLIVLAALAIVAASALPGIADRSVRSKVNEGLLYAGDAMKALEQVCAQDGTAVVKTNLDAAYFYLPSDSEQDFVQRIVLGADCATDAMAIVIWTSSTGADTDPVVEISAESVLRTEHGIEPVWTCKLIAGDPGHVPDECRNEYRKA